MSSIHYWERVIRDWVHHCGEKPSIEAFAAVFEITDRDRKILERLLTAPFAEGSKRLAVAEFDERHHRWFLTPCLRRGETIPVFRMNESIQHRDVVVFKGSRRSGFEEISKIGTIDNVYIYAKIAANLLNLPQEFPKEVLSDAALSPSLDVGNREDFRAFPLMTIDGEHAKDFDDAVGALPLEDGGWRVVVAIADVAFYVRPETPLDREAFNRGNSVYFPDCVIPMLPEILSHGICSLKPHEDRACLAVELLFSAEGIRTSYRFFRCLIRSQARLTYRNVQDFFENDPLSVPECVQESLKNLREVYQHLRLARHHRGALDFEIPESAYDISSEGEVQSVHDEPRYESHRLIEELMIAANVAAAEILQKHNIPTVYRVHPKPETKRWEGIRMILSATKIPWPKAKNLTAKDLNKIMHKTRDLPEKGLIQEMILKAQAQAVYSPNNAGHFGLNLSSYVHFTSPIRRYSDLLVHRGLLEILGEGEALSRDITYMTYCGEHLSQTERVSVQAERQVSERLGITLLESQMGELVWGQIAGGNGSGLFVRIGYVDGFLPKSSLGKDFFIWEEALQQYRGKRTGVTYQLGDRIWVRIEVADRIRSSLILSRVDDTETKIPSKHFRKRKNLRGFR